MKYGANPIGVFAKTYVEPLWDFGNLTFHFPELRGSPTCQVLETSTRLA